MRKLAVVSIASLLAMGVAADPAGAADLVGFYEASWAGLPAGTVRLKLSQDPATYRDEVVIETAGLPRWFTRFHGVGQAEGRLTADGSAEPGRYDAIYDLRKRRDSHISMRFAARDGGLVADRGPADTSRKPPLPETYRRDVVDPIAALATIRHRLLAAPPHAGDGFTVRVYDGARRFDVAVKVVAVGGPEAVVRLALSLVPIAGFKGDAGDDEDPDTAPRPVDVTFSADGRLVPLSMRVSIWLLPLTVQFRHACASYADCTASSG
jgi:hypothetical protein